MKINVRMLASHEGDVVRVVEIPQEVAESGDANAILDSVFYHGQNDFQPVTGICSVSVGDVIDYDGKHCVVRPFGFGELSAAELVEYVKIPRRDRSWSQFVRPDTD